MAENDNDIEQSETLQADETPEYDDNEELIANQLAIQQEAEMQRLAAEAEAAQNEPVPMSLGFFIPFIIICIIGDLIDIFTAGTLGWLIGLFIDAIILIATGISKAGRNQFKSIVIGLIGETIPIIDVLPFRTISLTWGFIKSRSKIAAAIDEKLPAASKVTKMVSKAA